MYVEVNLELMGTQMKGLIHIYCLELTHFKFCLIHV